MKRSAQDFIKSETRLKQLRLPNGSLNLLIKLMSRAGLEPATLWLKAGSCIVFAVFISFHPVALLLLNVLLITINAFFMIPYVCY